MLIIQGTIWGHSLESYASGRKPEGGCTKGEHHYQPDSDALKHSKHKTQNILRIVTSCINSRYELLKQDNTNHGDISTLLQSHCQ